MKHFVKVLLLASALALAGISFAQAPSSAAPEKKLLKAGSTFPAPSSGDQALAQGTAARREKGLDEESKVLLEALEKADAGDAGMDPVAHRLADFAYCNAGTARRLLGACGRDRLARLTDGARTSKDFGRQILFGEEFLRRFSSDPKAPGIKHQVARASMIAGADEKKALGMWDELIADRSAAETSAGRNAALYTEAVRGPQSIAAVEAAYEIAHAQSRDAMNPIRACFSDSRIIEASKREFFRQYLDHPDIAARDKADILYLVLYAHHQMGDHELTPQIANDILALTGYEGKLAEQTAYAVPLSYHLRMKRKEAAEGYEAFIRSYPKSSLAPTACIMRAQALHEMGDAAGAVLQYNLTIELYPGTPEAKSAKNDLEMMLDHDVNKLWQTRAAAARPRQLARLQAPMKPAEAWPVRPERRLAWLNSNAKQTAGKDVNNPTPPPPASSPQFKRLASLIASTNPAQER